MKKVNFGSTGKTGSGYCHGMYAHERTDRKRSGEAG